MMKALALAAVLAAGAGAASAATVAFSATPTDDVANPLATSHNGYLAENTTGSIDNVRLSPWAWTSDPDGLYTAVTGAATYEFGSDRTTLSFVWGSPDDYNAIAFYDDGVLVDVFDYDVPPFGSNLTEALATFTGIEGGLFDAVTFVSGRAAFEFANLAAVPVPAGGLLLLTALGGMGLQRRRKAA